MANVVKSLAKQRAVGFAGAPTFVLLFIGTAMALCAWFFGTGLAHFSKLMLDALIDNGLAIDLEKGIYIIAIFTILGGVALLTTFPAVIGLTVATVLEERFSPRIMPTISGWSDWKLMRWWSLLSLCTPIAVQAAHENGWDIATYANSHGLENLWSWQFMLSASLAVAATSGASALAFLTIELIRRIRSSD